MGPGTLGMGSEVMTKDRQIYSEAGIKRVSTTTWNFSWFVSYSTEQGLADLSRRSLHVSSLRM